MSQLCKRLLRDQRAVSAVEFALVFPLFILLLLGVASYTAVAAVYTGTQELVAEAARASVAGISDSERAQIVTNFISANASSYAFLDPTKISASCGTINAAQSTYQVNLSYDASGLFAYDFSSIIPLPSPYISRSAVVVNGGV
jgi:Flp pilus assembly protein TadG